MRPEILFGSHLHLLYQNNVRAIAKSAFYDLINIARIKSLVSQKDQQKFIHDFIFNEVDYCNGL